MFQHQPKKELILNRFRTLKFYVIKYDRSETSELNFGIGETVCCEKFKIGYVVF